MSQHVLPPGLHFPKGCPLRRRPPAPPLSPPPPLGPPQTSTSHSASTPPPCFPGFPPSLFFSSCPPLTFPTYSVTSTHAPGLEHACWLTDLLPSPFKALPSVLCSICITEHPPGSGAGEGGKTRREGSLISPEPFLVGKGDSRGGDLRACYQTAVNILGWSSVLLVTPSSGTGGAVPPTKKQMDGAWGLRSKLSVSSFLLVRAQGWEAGQPGQESWRGHISPSVPPCAQRRGQGR